MVESLHQTLLLEQRQDTAANTIDWVEVQSLTPESFNFNIVVSVHSIEVVAERMTDLGRIRRGEVSVGDETGSVILSARNEQIDMLVPGSTVVVRQGRIDMFDGYIRLRVDKFGTLKTHKEAAEDGESLPRIPETIHLALNISESKHEWVH